MWSRYQSRCRPGCEAVVFRCQFTCDVQVPEDEVLWGTPRKPLLEVKSPKSPSTPPNGKNHFHLRSPFSEASTKATSSCPNPKVVGHAAISAASRLAIAFNRVTLRSSAHAWRKLRSAAHAPDAEERQACLRTEQTSKVLLACLTWLYGIL